MELVLHPSKSVLEGRGFSVKCSANIPMLGFAPPAPCPLPLCLFGEVVQNTPSFTGTAANNVNTEALALLIQKLPQSRIRTAARRLGIADQVDGKYQKLGILRMQLKGKLELQPMEVAQVLKGLETA